MAEIKYTRNNRGEIVMSIQEDASTIRYCDKYNNLLGTYDKRTGRVCNKYNSFVGTGIAAIGLLLVDSK
jgi:hypothetical protein